MVNEATAIDKKNGDAYWQDVVTMEMESMKVAFNILPKDEKAPNGTNMSTATGI